MADILFELSITAVIVAIIVSARRPPRGPPTGVGHGTLMWRISHAIPPGLRTVVEFFLMVAGILVWVSAMAAIYLFLIAPTLVGFVLWFHIEEGVKTALLPHAHTTGPWAVALDTAVVLGLAVLTIKVWFPLMQRFEKVVERRREG